MNAAFPTLFSPIRLRGIELRNRTMMAAMSSELADEHGRVTERQIATTPSALELMWAS